MGLKLLGSSFSPFPCIGITFATFRKSGNVPLVKDTLIISHNGFGILLIFLLVCCWGQ